MFDEHDRVVLTGDIRESKLKTGDVGTIVHVYSDRDAFEIEFLTPDGYSAAVATVLRSQVRPVAGTPATAARKSEPTEISHGARGQILTDNCGSAVKL